MDLILIRNIFGIILALFGVAKIVNELVSKKKSKLKEDYTFSKSFLEDVKKNNLHPYLLEKGYQALAGSHVVNAKEIAYILTLKDSERWLRGYIFSIKYLVHLAASNNTEIVFNKKYKKKWSRLWRKSLYLLTYVVFALLAMSPFLTNHGKSIPIGDTLIQLAFTLSVFGFIAGMALIEGLKIKEAEELVEKQDRYEKLIEINT